MATDIGLFQIDKSTEAVTFLNKENSELPDNHIQTLSKDQAGNLWIGTYNVAMAVAPQNGGSWTIINYPTLASGLTVYNSDIAPNGDLWLACNQGVLQYDGQNWTQHMLSCAASGPPEVWDVKVNAGSRFPQQDDFASPGSGTLLLNPKVSNIPLKRKLDIYQNNFIVLLKFGNI